MSTHCKVAVRLNEKPLKSVLFNCLTGPFSGTILACKVRVRLIGITIGSLRQTPLYLSGMTFAGPFCNPPDLTYQSYSLPSSSWSVRRPKECLWAMPSTAACYEESVPLYSNLYPKEKLMSGNQSKVSRPPESTYEKPVITHKGTLKQFSGSPLGGRPDGNPLGLPGSQ